MVKNAPFGRVGMFIPDFGGGGAERVAITLGNAMVRRGVPVDMVAMRAVGPLREKLDPGVRVIDLDAERIRHAAGPLAQYLRTHRPTALVAHMWPLPVVALFARARAAVNARIIGVSHTTWSKAELFGCWRKRAQMVLTTRLFYRHLDAVVAVSSGVADDVVKISGLPRARVRIVYNAICGARDAETPSSSGSSVAWMHGSHRKILAVGTLTAMKGFDDLLSAFARVRQRADARLLILGEGPARDALADQIERLGVEDAVEMPGFVADPRAYYRAADLFVLSRVSRVCRPWSSKRLSRVRLWSVRTARLGRVRSSRKASTEPWCQFATCVRSRTRWKRRSRPSMTVTR